MILGAMLCAVTLCSWAQDWNGRVYMCSQEEELRQYMIAEITSDPEFESQSFEEKQFMSTFLNCIDVKLGMKFKKDNKVTTSFYLSLNNSRFSKSGIPAFAREELNRQIQQMSSDMKDTSTYSIDGKVLTIGDEQYTISDDEKELTVTDEDGLVLTFKRK